MTSHSLGGVTVDAVREQLKQLGHEDVSDSVISEFLSQLSVDASRFATPSAPRSGRGALRLHRARRGRRTSPPKPRRIARTTSAAARARASSGERCRDLPPPRPRHRCGPDPCRPVRGRIPTVPSPPARTPPRVPRAARSTLPPSRRVEPPAGPSPRPLRRRRRRRLTDPSGISLRQPLREGTSSRRPNSSAQPRDSRSAPPRSRASRAPLPANFVGWRPRRPRRPPKRRERRPGARRVRGARRDRRIESTAWRETGRIRRRGTATRSCRPRKIGARLGVDRRRRRRWCLGKARTSKPPSRRRER